MATIQSFFKDIKKASTGHRISSIGIEFGSSSIKMVEFVEDKGEITLHNYGELDLGPLVDKPVGSIANLSEEKLQEAMLTLLNNVPVSHPEAVSVAIPLSATLVVPLEVKANSVDELDVLIKSELESKVPVPLDQVYIDWQIVAEELVTSTETQSDLSNSNNSSNQPTVEVQKIQFDVLVFIINKDIIDTYKQVLKNLGLEIEYFELEVYSVMRSAVSKGTKQALIVDIGARYTKIYIVDNEKITFAIKKLQGGVDFTRAIEHILQIDFAKAESLKRHLKLDELDTGKLLDGLHKQIDTIITSIEQTKKQYFESTAGDVPIYLCGGGSLLYGLPEYLASKLNTKIIICQPFANAIAPQFLDKLLVETGPEYAVAAGLSLKYIYNI